MAEVRADSAQDPSTPLRPCADEVVAERVDGEYVLGTHDEEIARLGLQHEAWRATVLDCWRRAGVSAGARVLDVGAGPGYAAFDLAEAVGPAGEVTAVERSGRFVGAGRAGSRSRGLSNVRYHELDLMSDPLPVGTFDVAWCRWVCSFVHSPGILIQKLADAVRPGGVAVFHEYVDYASWRFSPRAPLMEDYVRRVMDSWRDAGGEPDVGTSLPPLLAANGFVIREAVPRVFCVRPGDALWRWISTFVESNLKRLNDLRVCDAAWTDSVRSEFHSAEADPTTLMITPMVLELIADRVS